MARVLKNFVPVIIIFVVAFTFSGCGQKQSTQKKINPTAVKVIKILRTDAPFTYEYSGQVIGKAEVKVLSKISGRITDKYISGGQRIEEGQILYKIDSRQYEASIEAQESIGTYVNAGNTNLVTISSNDPIFVDYAFIGRQHDLSV